MTFSNGWYSKFEIHDCFFLLIYFSEFKGGHLWRGNTRRIYRPGKNPSMPFSSWRLGLCGDGRHVYWIRVGLERGSMCQISVLGLVRRGKSESSFEHQKGWRKSGTRYKWSWTQPRKVTSNTSRWPRNSTQKIPLWPNKHLNTDLKLRDQSCQGDIETWNKYANHHTNLTGRI